MSITSSVVTLSPRDYDAVLFDLDGVLTRTARMTLAVMILGRTRLTAPSPTMGSTAAERFR